MQSHSGKAKRGYGEEKVKGGGQKRRIFKGGMKEWILARGPQQGCSRTGGGMLNWMMTDVMAHLSRFRDGKKQPPHMHIKHTLKIKRVSACFTDNERSGQTKTSISHMRTGVQHVRSTCTTSQTSSFSKPTALTDKPAAGRAGNQIHI